MTLFFTLVVERKVSMLEDMFSCPRVRRRIRQNPLGSILEEFVDYLIARRYQTETVHSYVFAVEHCG